jgi:ATP-dependent helicase/DNAse subunit B
MSLKLIQGPPNSGRAGLVRHGLLERLGEDPVLVVPTVDDVYGFERELCADGALLGAGVMTFTGLFSAVATAGGASPGAELTGAQRLGAVSAAIVAQRPRLGPLRRSAEQPGFVVAFERLLEELQAAGRSPADVEALAATLEGSAYLGDVATLFAAYAGVRDDLRTVDRHGIAREAIELLERDGSFWTRPVFLYGLDDMTPNQLDLIRALRAVADVVVAIPHEAGNEALEQRTAPLLEALEEMGVDSRVVTEADPGNTDSPLLFHLERGFGAASPSRLEPDASLLVLRSAGERGEAEAIAAEVARLLSSAVEPEEIAIVLRDPSRRGPLFQAVLEGCGIATALEAEVPIATTSVGGTLIALLEAEFGSARAGDLLRYLRGPSAVSSARVDRFERELRQRRVQGATDALALWEAGGAELPADLNRLRDAAGDPAGLAAEVGSLATAMGARAGGELELRAAGAIANAMTERARLAGLVPDPTGLPGSIASIRVRVWSGPVEDRVRIADPRRLRAARFDHVFVASLQEGEFPRGPGSADPFLSEGQRASLELQPRRDSEAEERYLFHACLALPRRRLCLSYRDCDENGAAEAPSPLLDDLRRLLDPGTPAGDEERADPFAARTRSRDLATVVHRVGEAPSDGELARAVAAQGTRADRGALLALAGAEGEVGERLAERLTSAGLAERATRAPGPLTNPAVIEALGGVAAYGGTTLEGFDLCSYRWFVSHELAPQPLDPVPDPLVQGGIMHAALEELYRERPGGDPLPRPGSLAEWTRRSAEVVAEVAAQNGLGDHPAERAMLRRVEGLLARFLAEEAARETGGLEPWLLEAAFGEEEDAERASLEIDGWRLHGAIDRVDRGPDGRALVIDYKLSSKVSSREKLEEEAKLQLQLYLIAVADLWGAETVGGIYHPMRGTSSRQPRGLVLDEAADQLRSYGLSRTDKVGREEFEEMLADARRRAGTIVARMRSGSIDRDPGPKPGLRGHGVCPPFCDFATICRRDRAPVDVADDEDEEGES